VDTTDPGSDRLDLEALRALEHDALELERLERLLDRFNVFEAIGFVEQEVKHSHFLAFLLDPNQNHGLEDHFLRNLLREALTGADAASIPMTVEGLEDLDLSQTLVRREHQHVDILITNESHKLVVIVENKISTTEHSDQLDRYHRIVQKDYHDWRVFGIYLTPFGDAPSHEAYLPLSYWAVCRVSEGVLEDRGAAPSPDVRMAVEHYAEMVRRNIVDDADVSRLSRRLYRKHHRAIHRIVEDMDATYEAMHRLVRGLIRETPAFDYGYRESRVLKDWIIFDHREWDVTALKLGKRHRNSDRLLYFVFYSDFSESLEISLELGPGDTVTRDRLVAMARKNPSTFVVEPGMTERLTILFKRTLLTGGPLDELSGEEREQEVRRQWAAFLEEDLHRIEAALDKETWIWAASGTSEAG
jgi:PD-(D/E)XK nuclease superfamily